MLKADGDVRRWPNLRVQGVTELEWLALAAVLERELFSSELASTESDEGEHGAIVRPFSDDALAYLAGLSAADRASLFKSWKDAADGLKNAAAVLDQLCAFATDAMKKRLPVLYFDSW